MSNARGILLSCLILLSVGGAVYAAQPVIQGVSIPDVSMKIGDAVTATITVQADASVFTMNASNIGGYALSGLSKQNDTTYEAQFTVTSGGTDYAAGADIPTSVELEDGGLTDTWSTAISQANDLIDANAPTVVVNIVDASLSDSDNSSNVTFEFSEDVQNFTVDDLTPTNGSLSSFSAIDANSYSVTFTATDGVDATGSVAVGAGTYTDLAGNNGTAGSDTVDIDTENPTITQIIRDDVNPTNAAQVSMQIDFSESVDGVAIGNFTPVRTGGQATASIDSIVTVGPAALWIVRLNTVDDATGTLTIDLDSNLSGITDAAGNALLAGRSADETYDVDRLDPTVTVDIDASPFPTLYDGDPDALVTFEFSEDVTGFTIDDLTPTNGSLSSFVTVDANSYTVTFTATDGVDGTGSVAVGTGYTDTIGNTGTTGSDDVDIDRLNPTVTVNIVDASLSDSDNSSNVTIEFSEDVQNFTIDDLTPVNGTLSSFAQVDGDSYTVTFTASDGIDATGSVTVGASSYTDLPGNNGASGSDTVTIDTENPIVNDLVLNDTLITDSDTPGNATLLIRIQCSEEMDQTVTPTVIFDPTIASTLTWDASSGWDSATEYHAFYDVADGNVNIDTVTIDVEDLKDLAGNDQQDMSPWFEIQIDTLNPTVSSVTPSVALIYDGTATFTLTVDFSEDMDDGGTNDPILDFPIEDPTSTITFSSGNWPDSDTYVATYTLADANESVADIDVRVSGAKDANGNDLVAGTTTNVFDIDTENPSVLTVVADTDPMYEGDLVQQITVTFDEAMLSDGSADPAISFGAGTFTTNSDGAWSVGDTVWTETFTLTDNDEEITVVTVDVAGAKDAAGNDQEPYAEVDEFDIDTVKPSVSTVVVDTDPMYESDLIQQVVVTFDEAMGTGTDPTITFGAGTFASNSDGAWTVGDTVWTETFTLTDNNEEITLVTVDVTGAKDAAGNDQEPYAEVDEFDIDTAKPSVTTVEIDTDPMYEGDLIQQVTVTFDEAMDTGTDPAISFGAGTFASNSDGAWSVGNTVWTETFTLTDNDEEITVVTVDVTGAKDAALNNQEDYTAVDEFDIDTVKPTVTGVAVDDTLLSDSDAGTTLTVTVNFSEPMIDDGSSDPTLTFDPAVGSTLAFFSDSWPTSSRYEAVYTISDAGVDEDSVTIDATATFDASGNPQENYAPLHEFEIDTLNPTVTSLVISDNLITDADVGDTFTVTIDYSEPMGTTTPSIAFSPSLDTTLSLQPGNSEWTDTDTYVFSYTILDGNTTVLDDDITITNAQDLAGNVQVAYNYDDQLDVDTENPYFHDFTVTGGAVDANCLRVVTFTAKVTDPNGTMVAGDITISNATVTNTAAGISVGDVYDISQTSDNQTTITITGKVDIEDLTGCPATVTITLDAVDSVDNDATQQSQSDDVVDTIIPVINDLRFDTDATHTAEQLVPYLVNECGLVTVYFSGNVTDNCCIVPANVNITATLPMLVGEGPAILEDFEFTPVQNGQGQVDFTGSAVVRCLESCPPAVCMSRVQINVTASDCCGNVAVPDSTGTGEGLVDDDILPIPRDDPRQDMVMDESAVIDPLVEVRLDEFGTYRLVLRESTPVRIDLMANDADNLSHNAAHPFQPCIACGPCGGQTGCCATMYIEDIVQHPSYGTATIEDDEGNCNGGTVIRYAPDRGYLGPDYFTYRIRDAFGNVSSVIATVYLQVVPEVWMEDVFVIACAGAPTEFEVSASDLFIDTDDPALIPFEFSLVGGPEHGVITGDFLDVSYTPPSTITDPQFGVQVPSLDFTEAASVTLWYTGADGYIGRDMARVQFDDPFGGSAVAVVDFTIGDCGTTTPPTFFVVQGEFLPLITPVSFESVEATGLLGVTLTAHSDGATYAAVSAVWSEDLNRYILILDTSGLPIGAYELRIPLGNDETVVMTIEVGEGE